MESSAPTKTKKDFFKVSKGVAIPKNTAPVKHPEFIPKQVAYEDSRKMLEQCAILIAKNIPILMIGETGTGKTSIARHLAHETGNGFVRVNHNGGTAVEDLIGRWTINKTGETEWVDGILIQAMKEGYWYLADEINAAGADINFVYHSLLDDDGFVVLAEKGSEVVIPHKNFRFFGAMNPPAEYAGTKELNKALLSRFAVLNVDFPSPAVEAKIVADRTGINIKEAEAMVKFAANIRAGHAQEQYRCVVSTRDLIMWATLYKVYGKFMVSAESSILNKVNTDDFEAIKDILSLNFKSIDDQGGNNAPVIDEDDLI